MVSCCSSCGIHAPERHCRVTAEHAWQGNVGKERKLYKNPLCGSSVDKMNASGFTLPNKSNMENPDYMETANIAGKGMIQWPL